MLLKLPNEKLNFGDYGNIYQYIIFHTIIKLSLFLKGLTHWDLSQAPIFFSFSKLCEIHFQNKCNNEYIEAKLFCLTFAMFY